MVKSILNHTSLGYGGKYVALKEFGDPTIIGSGTTPKEAHDRATAQGYNNPIITFVPAKGMVQIY